MLHLFMGVGTCDVVVDKEIVSGDAIFVASNTEHIPGKENVCKLFFLFDPTSSYAEQAKTLYLKEKSYCVIDIADKSFLNRIEEKTDEEIIAFSKELLERIFEVSEEGMKKDERILKLVEDIKRGKYFHQSVAEIASDVYISESRLQHLFKETTGITLKNYLLMKQMEYCYKLVLAGNSITYAAMEAGFASPAHLAYTCKKQTGISITAVLK